MGHDRLSRTAEKRAAGFGLVSTEHRQSANRCAHIDGLATPTLPSFTHHLTHPGLGDLEIFLGPVARDGPGLTYEAVFD
jgi:hypothetical protein